MRPRSFERGNTAGCGSREGASDTSMGPRSFERGNDVVEYLDEFEFDTSMGPRSFERGNFAVLELNAQIPAGFNGAALF